MWGERVSDPIVWILWLSSWTMAATLAATGGWTILCVPLFSNTKVLWQCAQKRNRRSSPSRALAACSVMFCTTRQAWRPCRKYKGLKSSLVQQHLGSPAARCKTKWTDKNDKHTFINPYLHSYKVLIRPRSCFGRSFGRRIYS